MRTVNTAKQQQRHGVPVRSMSNIDLMEAELDEGVEILRPYYPDADDEHLRSRAAHWRHFRYEKGRWPTDQEIIAEIIATLAREVRAGGRCGALCRKRRRLGGVPAVARF